MILKIERNAFFKDLLAQSMETAGLPTTSPGMMELQSQLLEAETKAAKEKKLRTNYYNQQCRVKKEWEKKKVDFKIEISCLKRKVCDMEKVLQAQSATIESQNELIQKQTEQMESAEKDLNYFEAMLSERDRRVQKSQADYKKLMDELISAKLRIEEFQNSA